MSAPNSMDDMLKSMRVKDSKGRVNPLVSLGSLALLGGAAYYYYFYNQEKKQMPAGKTGTPGQPNPSPYSKGGTGTL